MEREGQLINAITIRLLAIAFVLSSVCCSNQTKRGDIDGYLDAKWGMSRREIKELVKLPLNNEVNNILMYSDNIGGDNVTRLYQFDNKDRLFAVMIVFEIVPEDEKTFRNVFIKSYNNLALKYGDADNYNDEDLNKSGLSAEWKFRSTRILFNLQMKRPFNKLALGLLYENQVYTSEYFKKKPINKY